MILVYSSLKYFYFLLYFHLSGKIPDFKAVSKIILREYAIDSSTLLLFNERIMDKMSCSVNMTLSILLMTLH